MFYIFFRSLHDGQITMVLLRWSNNGGIA